MPRATPRATEGMIQAMKDLILTIERGEPSQRLEALRKVKELIEPRLFDSLRNCLKDSDAKIRLHAAHILLRAHDDLGVGVLLHELKAWRTDHSELLYYKLMEEARRTGGVHDPRILTALEDNLTRLTGIEKIHAIFCLVFCGSSKGIESLTQLCNSIHELTALEVDHFLSGAISLPSHIIARQQGLLRNAEALGSRTDCDSLSNLPLVLEHMPPSPEVDVLLEKWTKSANPCFRQNAITALKCRKEKKEKEV